MNTGFDWTECNRLLWGDWRRNIFVFENIGSRTIYTTGVIMLSPLLATCMLPYGTKSHLCFSASFVNRG